MVNVAPKAAGSGNTVVSSIDMHLHWYYLSLSTGYLLDTLLYDLFITTKNGIAVFDIITTVIWR